MEVFTDCIKIGMRAQSSPQLSEICDVAAQVEEVAAASSWPLIKAISLRGARSMPTEAAMGPSNTRRPEEPR